MIAPAASPPGGRPDRVRGDASASNFYYSFRFLPRQQRQAILDIYAFCREVDDLVDDPVPGSDPAVALAEWRAEVEALYAGVAAPRHPIARRLAVHLRRYPLPREAFFAILDGVEMDLHHQRYATWSDLREYCHRVASAVGLLCIEVFGYRDPRTRHYAVELGLALQLTNILRDVGRDAQRGRIYLPGDELRRFGVTEADILERRGGEGFLRLMAHQCHRARDLFRGAEAALPDADRASLLAAEIMRRIYLDLLERIEGARGAVLRRTIRLPRHRKAWIALRAWLERPRRAIPAAG